MKKHSFEQLLGLEIATVDNFQGREKDIVLFSAVRANAKVLISHVHFVTLPSDREMLGF